MAGDSGRALNSMLDGPRMRIGGGYYVFRLYWIMEQSMKALSSVLDHLVYITPDVDQTIKDLGKKLGVDAIPGGQHQTWGTRNALIALGPKMYLEIMGPDPTLSRPGLKRPFDIDRLYKPRLVTWVSRSTDLDKTIELGRQLGVDLGEVQSGSRVRPDGTVLSWKMTDLMKPRVNGIVPYFINWGKSKHPASSAPAGCLLKELKAEHPNPNQINSILKAFGLDLQISHGKSTNLMAIIETKQGTVEI